MAKTAVENVEKSDKGREPPAGVAIHLKDPAWAAFLAWLAPGLGHLYQGRTAKAALFFVCIMSTYVYGLYLSSDKEYGWARAVYASWKPEDRRFHYLAQIGVGLPAMPALVQAFVVRDDKAPYGEFMAPPRAQHGEDDVDGRPTLSQLHRKMARYFELGSVYTMIAGLLNMLVIFDAFAGPVIVHEEPPEEEGEGDDDESDVDAGESDDLEKK